MIFPLSLQYQIPYPVRVIYLSIFIFILQSISFAQSDFLSPRNKNYYNSDVDNFSGKTGKSYLKSSDEIKSLPDSLYYSDWDSAGNCWYANYRIIFAYDKFGKVATEKHDFLSFKATQINPYLFYVKSYYPDGSLKDQETSIYSPLQLKYLGVTREHWDYDFRKNMINLEITYRDEKTDEWFLGYCFRQVYDKHNNLTGTFEYQDDSTRQMYLYKKQENIYNNDQNITDFYDSIYDLPGGSFWCNQVKHFKYNKGHEIECTASWNYSINPLKYIQKKTDTQYDSLGYIITRTYYSSSFSSEIILPGTRERIVYNSDMQPVQEYVDKWNNPDQKWEHYQWNTKIYNSNPGYYQCISKKWNSELQQYVNDHLEENLFTTDGQPSEHNNYVWENGWRVSDKVVYEYDSAGNILRVYSQYWNQFNSSLQNFSKKELYYSQKTVDPLPPDSAFELLVYPNPANDVLIVQKVPVGSTLEIFDMKGSLQLKTTVEDATVLINISSFNDGAYVLKAIYNGSEKRTVFVKVE